MRNVFPDRRFTFGPFSFGYFNGKLVELEVKEVVLDVKTKFLNNHICLDVLYFTDQSI